MTRCAYCRVFLKLYQSDEMVDAENCLGNSFEVPKPRVQSIFEWGFWGLLFALVIVALASSDLLYFQGIFLMTLFAPWMVTAGMTRPYDSRGYLHFLSCGAVASCYAYAVMEMRPSLPGFERFYTYYLVSAYLAFIFPLLFLLFSKDSPSDEKLWPKICCQCALEKHGWCGYHGNGCLHCMERAARPQRRREEVERAVAFLMSSHARLGASSEAGMLQGGGGPVEMILGFASEARQL